MVEITACISNLAARVITALYPSDKVDQLLEFRENMSHLKDDLQELRAAKQDVEHRIEGQVLRPSLEKVKLWLKNVDKETSEAENLLAEIGDRHVMRRLKYSGDVVRMIKRVNRLIECRFENTCGEQVPFRDRMALPFNFVYLKQYRPILNKVLRKDVSIIGIVGYEGGGISTLMKFLCNEVGKNIRNILFISSDSIDSIQCEIGRKLALDEMGHWERRTRTERSILINKGLRSKEIAIFFKNLKASIRLEEIGIEITKFPMKKVVFASTSQKICKQMQAEDVLSFETIPDDDASLLLKKICRVNDNFCNHFYFQQVVKSCGGNPTLLTLVGKAIGNVINVETWESAYKALEKVPKSMSLLEMDSQLEKAEMTYAYACITGLCEMFKMESNLEAKMNKKFHDMKGKTQKLEDLERASKEPDFEPASWLANALEEAILDEARERVQQLRDGQGD